MLTKFQGKLSGDGRIRVITPHRRERDDLLEAGIEVAQWAGNGDKATACGADSKTNPLCGARSCARVAQLFKEKAQSSSRDGHFKCKYMHLCGDTRRVANWVIHTRK